MLVCTSIARVYKYVCICVCVCMYVSMCVCVYVYVYACLCVGVYILCKSLQFAVIVHTYSHLLHCITPRESRALFSNTTKPPQSAEGHLCGIPTNCFDCKKFHALSTLSVILVSSLFDLKNRGKEAIIDVNRSLLN